MLERNAVTLRKRTADRIGILVFGICFALPAAGQPAGLDEAMQRMSSGRIHGVCLPVMPRGQIKKFLARNPRSIEDIFPGDEVVEIPGLSKC